MNGIRNVTFVNLPVQCVFGYLLLLLLLFSWITVGMQKLLRVYLSIVIHKSELCDIIARRERDQLMFVFLYNCILPHRDIENVMRITLSMHKTNGLHFLIEIRYIRICWLRCILIHSFRFRYSSETLSQTKYGHDKRYVILCRMVSKD